MTEIGVVPDDYQLRADPDNPLDSYLLKINLDPSLNWSNSVFYIDSNCPAPYQITLDVAHKTSSPPYILLGLSADATANIKQEIVKWRMSENVVLGRTFLQGKIVLVSR